MEARGAGGGRVLEGDLENCSYLWIDHPAEVFGLFFFFFIITAHLLKGYRNSFNNNGSEDSVRGIIAWENY